MSDDFLGMKGNHKAFTFDAGLAFYDSGATIATGNSPVLAIGTGFVDAHLVLTVTEAEGANSVKVQFATDEAFTTAVDSITIPIAGKGAVIVPFANLLEGDSPYGFVRLSSTVEASTGKLTMAAFITKR